MYHGFIGFALCVWRGERLWSTFKNCTSLQYFYPNSNKADTLVSGYNCIYWTLVLIIELTLKFLKRSMHRSHCFCHTSLSSLSEGINDRMLPENITWYFCNNYYFSAILSWLAWEVCTCYLISATYSYYRYEQFGHQKICKTVIILHDGYRTRTVTKMKNNFFHG